MFFNTLRNCPFIETERLRLRAFAQADGKRVQLLAGTHADVNNTSSIRHPYEYGTAEEWIATHQASYEKGEVITFAVGLKENTALIVAVSLMITQQHLRAERECWIGEPYLGRGIAVKLPFLAGAYPAGWKGYAGEERFVDAL